jgi:Ferric reductase like transmembrane component
VSLPLAAAGPSAYWYLARGTGAVTLILLTATTVLGIVDFKGWRSARWPRFAIDELHRTLSLLLIAFLVIHIISSVLDGFAPIRLIDGLIPFAGTYRPLWLGLGTLSFDLLVAITVTSLARRRIGHRAWRLVHWLAYASWPTAVLHGLGTGSDVKSAWLLVLTMACLVAVWLAAWLRLSGSRASLRPLAYAPLIAGPLALALWLPSGPLGNGWARRAGTPTSLLLASNVTGGHTTSASRAALSLPFSGSVSGSVHESQDQSGLAVVELSMSFSGSQSGVADIVLSGEPLAGGGVSVSQSRVTLGPASNPRLYTGRVTALDGGQLQASVDDGSGSRLRVGFTLNVDEQAGTVAGQVSARSEGQF